MSFRTRLALQRLESRDNPSDLLGMDDPFDPGEPVEPIPPPPDEPGPYGDPFDPPAGP